MDRTVADFFVMMASMHQGTERNDRQSNGVTPADDEMAWCMHSRSRSLGHFDVPGLRSIASMVNGPEWRILSDNQRAALTPNWGPCNLMG